MTIGAHVFLPCLLAWGTAATLHIGRDSAMVERSATGFAIHTSSQGAQATARSNGFFSMDRHYCCASTLAVADCASLNAVADALPISSPVVQLHESRESQKPNPSFAHISNLTTAVHKLVNHTHSSKFNRTGVLWPSA